MKIGEQRVLACTCRGTMPIEAGALARACGAQAEGPLAFELCRAEIGGFEAAAAQGGKLLVTCTQEAPEFRRAGEGSAKLGFVNIRETAGWSAEADRALPKIAALIAGATVLDPHPLPEISLRSEGVTLVYGSDDRAVEAAFQLKDRLDLTVIITGSAPLTPPRLDEFPVVRGTISRVTGHMGGWELVVDGFAEPLPSSRRVLEFGPARDGARSRCDLILDFSDGRALLPGHERRDGYLRASPGDPVAVQKVLLAAADLVGEFGKPRYVTLDKAKCAHSRNGQIGCTRCLDSCPMSAISPAGDSVAVDPYICAGCGTCAAVCPTTAVRYAEPGAEAVARWLRTVLTACRAAGGATAPALLLHDEAGAEMVELLARHGDGLPARVIPLPMAGQFGLDAFATALAFGAAELLVLAPRNRERREATQREIELIAPIMEALGYGAGRVRLLEAEDPFQLGEAVWSLLERPGPAPASYLPTGDKIALTSQALAALHAAAPSKVKAVPLPRGAPIGRVLVDTAGCTLCLSCVSVCPTSALRDNDERPLLSFIEDLCVQCGLCATTCPEDVVSLEPRATFGSERREAVILKEEEPALCVSCGKPFGTKSSIDKIAAQLAGKHWMFKDPAMTDRIRMCADCRVIAQAQTRLDPYAGPPRPMTRTTDDYKVVRATRGLAPRGKPGGDDLG